MEGLTGAAEASELSRVQIALNQLESAITENSEGISELITRTGMVMLPVTPPCAEKEAELQQSEPGCDLEAQLVQFRKRIRQQIAEVKNAIERLQV